jgi:hypothetical protein
MVGSIRAYIRIYHAPRRRTKQTALAQLQTDDDITQISGPDQTSQELQSESLQYGPEQAASIVALLQKIRLTFCLPIPVRIK